MKNAGATSRFSLVLLTGPPGVGKTTICKKVASTLEKRNSRIDGFYTEEVRASGGRIGFDVVLVKDREKRTPLARVGDILDKKEHSKYRVGNYHVFSHNFETAVLPVFTSNANVLFIDEIGKMELFSDKFYTEVQKILFSSTNKHCIIATIPQMHKIPQRFVPFFEKLTKDTKSKVITVSRQNRDTVPQEIIDLISQNVE